MSSAALQTESPVQLTVLELSRTTELLSLLLGTYAAVLGEPAWHVLSAARIELWQLQRALDAQNPPA